MKVAWEMLVAAVLVAASILFIGRYQISAAVGEGPFGKTQAVYRLDRWTGKVDDLCHRTKNGWEGTPWAGTSLECAK